ncbi:MAG: right-handed parallel beta-helix repeat-containing protein [Chloroflexi bacterium]|nr:right-handed parallel beta-helix repeat-containing protein [Chloroflexota bacterium]
MIRLRIARALLRILLLLLLVSVFPVPALAQAEPSIIYQADTNTIEVKKPGSVVNLTDIYNVLRDDKLLAQVGPRQWLLKANLRIYELVRLELHGGSAGGDVDWLKLSSGPSGYVNIESSNGQISIRSTRITSWDEKANAFDTAFLDGSKRAFIAAKNRSSIYTTNRMDVIDSEIAYLGFFEETAYGISWKVVSEEDAQNPGILGRGMTGTVSGSKFHHNYFGVYVWGVGGMEVRNNEFYDNYRYGFDAHTVTQRVTVEDNYSHDNGSHGIIFADRCTENVIRNNRSIDNDGHGIMLHELSNNNIVDDNEVIGNDDGVALFESSNNVVARNIIRNNVTGVRIYGRVNVSSENLIEDNEISRSDSYGVFMYDAAEDNKLNQNRIISNRDSGIYLKSVSDNQFSSNEVNNNEFGVRIDSDQDGTPSSGNQFINNTIQRNRRYGVYSFPAADSNSFASNLIAANGIGDVVFSAFSPAPEERGGRSILETVRLLLLGIIIAASLITVAIILLRRRPRPPLTGGSS